MTFDALLDSFRFDAGREYAPRGDRDALLIFVLLCAIGGAIYRKTKKDRDRGWRSRRADRDQGPTEQGPDPTGYLGP